MAFSRMEKSGLLWESAARYASKKSLEGRKERKSFYRKRETEQKKVRHAGEYLRERLQQAVKQVPSIQYMNAFHRTILESSTDLPKFKKSIAQIQKTSELIERWEAQAMRQLNETKPNQAQPMGQARFQFFGKSKNALQRLNPSIERYNEGIRCLNELPKIDWEQKTVVIAGFPNVGKSTLLKRITGSAPEIAHYPFTTKGVMVGKLVVKHQPIQFLDTPGLLDRQLEKRNAIERKAIAALEHVADGVLFVIDPTLESGFDLESQKRLLESMKQKIKKPFLLVLNKCDTAGAEELEAAKRLFSQETIIQTGNGARWEENGKERVMGWIQELKKKGALNWLS